jgi:hypothetical protein
MPVPTKEWVEAQSGIWHGEFLWPITDDDDVRFWGFKHGKHYPEDHLRHDCHVGNKVIVFSLYCGSWTKKSSEPDTIPEGEYSGVTSKAKYTNKQIRKRNKKRETA